jgi:hypothetical protein
MPVFSLLLFTMAERGCSSKRQQFESLKTGQVGKLIETEPQKT